MKTRLSLTTVFPILRSIAIVRLMPNTDVIENACENNLDLQHLGGKLR